MRYNVLDVRFGSGTIRFSFLDYVLSKVGIFEEGKPFFWSPN